jgi:16S rRNA G966 N2-methylase RsmD
MYQKKIIKNKLFPCPPDNNYENLMIDMESTSYVSTPYVSSVITGIIESLIPGHIALDKLTIFDGTACVGGDTIALGRTFGSVIAAEIDETRYNMLVNNLNEFKLWNVIPINDDSLNLLYKINFIDVMYFDPPWGGKIYKYKNNLRLKIGDMYLDQIVNHVFDGKVKSDVKMIVLKLPKNYNLYELYKKTNKSFITMYLYELNKMLIVVFKKNDYI